MALLGYLASLLIGLSLGLIGGGGSILTVPVMVYLFGLTPVAATSYSLFVVGATSLVGALHQYRKGLVNIRMGLLFAISSTITVMITRQWLLPLIPETIGTFGNLEITKNRLMMVLFAALMLVSAFYMVKGSGGPENKEEVQKAALGKLLLYGTGIGLITGLLGAGGGFLMIPALVMLLKLPIREAVGTSLLVIAVNSLTGFSGDLLHNEIDWNLLLLVSSLAIAGILGGMALGKSIAPAVLKKGFGWFVLLMGVMILLKEL